MHALTPLLFALAWCVVWAQQRWEDRGFVGAVYPLTAMAVCLAALPLARVFRRRVDAASAQTVYLALAWLTPWLVFAWFVAQRTDSDGVVAAPSARVPSGSRRCSCSWCFRLR